MRTLIATAAAFWLAGGVALACDDHIGTCEIEDWRWQAPFPGTLMLDGVVTCNSGKITLRLYEGAGEDARFLGVSDTYIEAHTFQALASGIDAVTDLQIKYAIDPNR